MTGPELTFLEAAGRSRRHLSVVLANGRPVFTADTDLAAALVRAVLG